MDQIGDLAAEELLLLREEQQHIAKKRMEAGKS